MGITQETITKGLTIIENMMNSIKVNINIDLQQIELFVEELIKGLLTHIKYEILDPVPLNDMSQYQVVHTLNVTIYSILFGIRLKKNKQDLIELGVGSILHDIGKVNIPDHIAWHQDSNGEIENKLVLDHTLMGAHLILSQYPTISDNIINIIKDHHENFDGSGYPKNLKGINFNSLVNIVSICNFYDFLTTQVPGKKEYSKREALFEILQCIEYKFHPKFVSSFINLLGPNLIREPLYKRTAIVLLDSKEIAAVMRVNRFGDVEPEILLLTNKLGKKLSRPIPINLKYDRSRKIVKLLNVG